MSQLRARLSADELVQEFPKDSALFQLESYSIKNVAKVVDGNVKWAAELAAALKFPKEGQSYSLDHLQARRLATLLCLMHGGKLLGDIPAACEAPPLLSLLGASPDDKYVSDLKVSGELAGLLLLWSRGNRRVSRQRVDSYRQAIIDDAFVRRPFEVVDGKYISDGHHRLFAVLLEGVSKQFSCILDVTELESKFTDIGRVRTITHSSQMAGEIVTKEAVAAFRLLDRFITNDKFNSIDERLATKLCNHFAEAVLALDLLLDSVTGIKVGTRRLHRVAGVVLMGIESYLAGEADFGRYSQWYRCTFGGEDPPSAVGRKAINMYQNCVRNRKPSHGPDSQIEELNRANACRIAFWGTRELQKFQPVTYKPSSSFIATVNAGLALPAATPPA